MGYFDPHNKTQVIVDASPVGLSAILTQFTHPKMAMLLPLPAALSQMLNRDARKLTVNVWL
jgi:hypothetical protein